MGFGQSSGKQAVSFGKVNFQSKSNFRLSRVSEIVFKVFSQGFGTLALGFFTRFISQAKVLVCKVIFPASTLANLALAFCSSAVLVFAKSGL